MSDFDKLRTTAKFILENAAAFKWSLQGLGMLRLHMGDDTRLHVWDLRFAFPGASPIHDHQQWALHSTILSGSLCNYRFEEHPGGSQHLYQTMKAGHGCYALHEPREIRLRCSSGEFYEAGDCYSQEPREIHKTVPTNGTVTIMRKTPTKDSELARVFWPAGTEWGSAEPRAATASEIAQITAHALRGFTNAKACESKL